MTHKCDGCGREVGTSSDRVVQTKVALCASCLNAMLEQVFSTRRGAEPEKTLPRYWEQACAIV